MDVERNFPVIQSSDPMFDVASLHIEDESYLFETRRRAAGFLTSVTSTAATVFKRRQPQSAFAASKMLAAEYLTNILDMIDLHTESSEIHKSPVFSEMGMKPKGATLIMNTSLNATESAFAPELFYRHSMAMTAVYCVAYLLVFAVGLVGNCFVIAVVFRSPRMRTVTNFFIVNLAVADILVIVFCLPATLMANIFVREYNNIHSFYLSICVIVDCVCVYIDLYTYVDRCTSFSD